MVVVISDIEIRRCPITVYRSFSLCLLFAHTNSIRLCRSAIRGPAPDEFYMDLGASFHPANHIYEPDTFAVSANG
jgi:hypothetical protein